MAGRIIIKGVKGNTDKIIKYKERINNKDKVISLGIKINEKYFNDKNEWYKWIRDKHPQAQQLNEQIADFLKSKGYLNPNHKDYGLIYLIENKVIINKLNYSTHRNYIVDINRFRIYLNITFNKDDIKINQVDRSLLVGYLHYLKKEYPTGNTARQKLSVIKSSITDLKINHNITFPNNLLDKLVIKKVKSNKDFLSFREVNVLKYSYLPHKRNYDLSVSRYAFIFSVIANGIRVSDTLLMKYSNIKSNNGDYYLIFDHKKTGKNDSIILNDELLYIIGITIINKGVLMGRHNITLISNFKQLISRIETEQINFYDELTQYEPGLIDIIDIEKQKKQETALQDIANKIDGFKSEISAISKTLLDNYLSFFTKNDSYIFDYIPNYLENHNNLDIALKYSRTTYNRHLKEIGERLNINLKNSHQARHTMTNLNIQAGTNTYYLSSKILKHQDLNQSQSYINDIKEQYNNDTTTYDIINNNKQF